MLSTFGREKCGNRQRARYVRKIPVKIGGPRECAEPTVGWPFFVANALAPAYGAATLEPGVTTIDHALLRVCIIAAIAWALIHTRLYVATQHFCIANGISNEE